MSIAAKVELYISKRPYVREALAEDIINYSALARKIASEENLKSEDAVKAALSRYQDVIASERNKRKDKVSSILKKTKIEITSNLSAVKDQEKDAIVSSKTKNGYTSVVVGGDKSLVTLESPVDLETTPGVLDFILSSIAAKGINVDHMISCREDTHLVIDSSDASEVLDLMQERIG